MQGNPGVIEALQKAASMESSLAAQYRLDKHDLKYRGLKCLAGKISDLAKESCGYQKEIVDRIFFLGAKPSIQTADAATAATVTELFTRALAAETAIVTFYNDAAIEAMNAKDDNTRNKFEHWIKWHEDNHIDWLEQQLAQIESMGEQQYIQIQLTK